jgi:hypothetical protein
LRSTSNLLRQSQDRVPPRVQVGVHGVEPRTRASGVPSGPPDVRSAGQQSAKRASDPWRPTPQSRASRIRDRKLLSPRCATPSRLRSSSTRHGAAIASRAAIAASPTTRLGPARRGGRSLHGASDLIAVESTGSGQRVCGCAPSRSGLDRGLTSRAGGPCVGYSQVRALTIIAVVGSLSGSFGGSYRTVGRTGASCAGSGLPSSVTNRPR